MADESKPLPARPPSGMIKIEGLYQLRRFGLLVQRELTCIFGHRIHVGARPFEIAIPCDFQEARGSNVWCPAQLYIFTTRQRFLWAMDVTAAESEIIDQHSMDVHAIVAHFGAGFPMDMKIVKKPRPH